jgi:hypothetical protein
MESRRQRPTRTHRLRKKTKPGSSPPASSLPHLQELIEHGEITVGMQPFGACMATATDADCTYAMLVRRDGESLLQFLIRLDEAVDKALTLGIYTDEINP